MIDLPPPPPPGITLELAGDLWRVKSADGRFEGVFVDRRSAVREAAAELEAHRAGAGSGAPGS